MRRGEERCRLCFLFFEVLVLFQTFEEFKRVMLGFRYDASATYTNKLYHPKITDAALPETVDWRPKGYVTAIKNQVGIP